MDSINVASNLESKPILNQPANAANKPTYVAYNDTNFSSLINRELGLRQFESLGGTQSRASQTQTKAKSDEVENLEYKSFVNKSMNRPRVSVARSNKRALRSFNPVPTGKKIAAAYVKPESNIAKPVNNIAKPAFEKVDTNSFDYSIAQKPAQPVSESNLAKQIQSYKEDQLLSNPGGDNVFLNRKTGVIDNNFDHSKLANRVGKDLDDAFSNFKNMIKDLGGGSEIKYFDNNGNVKTHKKRGLLKTVGNFFKNMASGLSFGAYTPKNEEVPAGVAGRVKHFFNKVFVQAIVKDISMGVPQSVINVGEDALFAGLNLIETIPDATIGNTELGRKATTKVFDNAQVAMDFATDIMPGGEASTRMKSFVASKLKGLKGEKGLDNSEDAPQWQYVRHSPFRKAIEALSFIMPFRM